MSKKILIINGHPDKLSFCSALSEAYKKGALSTSAKVKELNIRELEFKINLEFGYRKRTDLEPCLIQAQKDIFEADHLVIIHPVWWGSMPAIMKGFFDRIFLPGFFFKKIPNSKKWEKLLINKSARIIYTLDTPRLLWWIVGRPSYHALKYVTLGYCGVKPIKGTPIGIIRLSTEEQREKWLKKIEKLGSKNI